jgi:membrane-bound lytic murein transglycosylase A
MFRQVGWNELPGWREDNVAEAWSAFVAGCSALATRDVWRDVCAASARLANPAADAARAFFETNFVPYQVRSETAGDEGLATGYYEPLLRGSRRQTARYRFPIYGVPDDLVVVDLAEVYPELKNMRLRGRLEGRRLVPYYERARIDGGEGPVRGKEIAWVDDVVELFFLHVQGSGRILLDNGETLRVGYADQNGHPYRSIGRVLIDRGELVPDQVSMQSIQAWARRNPTKVNEVLNSNASYVFFRELPASASGPPGSLGVPLTPRRSIAVDPRYVPLGAPVFIATTWPNSPKPLHRLMLAQDTGGAIRGSVRADFFWGYGEAAAWEAGRMKQRLRMWMLWPRGQPVPVTSEQ